MSKGNKAHDVSMALKETEGVLLSAEQQKKVRSCAFGLK